MVLQGVCLHPLALSNSSHLCHAQRIVVGENLENEQPCPSYMTLILLHRVTFDGTHILERDNIMQPK